MAAKAEKFIIALQAQYQGDEAVSRLQSDLDNLGRVEKLQKWQAEMDKSTTTMQEAAAEAARLKTVMESSFDERILGRLEKAQNNLAGLEAKYRSQEEALLNYKARVDKAGEALAAFSAGMSKTPTEEESAKLARLSASLSEAQNRYQRHGETMAKTADAVRDTGHRVSELAEALQRSVDPAVNRQYEEQLRIFERQGKTAESLRGKIDATTATLKEQGVSTKDLIQTQAQLAAATKDSGQQMAAMRRLGIQSFSGIETEAQKLKRAWADLDKSNMSLRERLTHWGKYKEQLAEARRQTKGWTDQVHKLQQGWAGVLGVIGGLSLVKIGLGMFVEFDDAMLKVQALSKSTGEEFAMLKKQAMDLGATTRFTATDAAQGMSELAATGMDAREIFETLPAAMDMAAISGMGVKDSADKITDIMSQFGLETENAVHVVDVLTQGYTGASTSMEELAQAMVYVGPLANTVGYSLEETTAILQALAESGYKGEKAGTALRGGLSRLLKPSGAAAEALAKYNIQVLDSSGQMRSFADILEDLGKTSMSSAEMITLFGQEAGPGMMALLNQGSGAIREFEDQLRNVDGLAGEMAEKMESGIGGSLRKLASSIASVAIAFGDTFAPAVRLVAGGLSSLAAWVAGLSEPIRGMIGWVSGAITAFAMWKMGIGLMAGAMVRFGLDLAGVAVKIWAFATQSVPVFITAMRSAGAATLSFRGGLIQAIASLPLVGGLLTTTTKQLFDFSGAASKAGAAMKLVSAAGMLLAAWEFGKMVGGWLGGFDFVQKAAIKTMEIFHLLGLRAQWAWRALTGGDTGEVTKKIEDAKAIYAEMYADIGKSAEQPVQANEASQEAITKKIEEEAAKQVQVVEEATAAMTAAYDEVDPDAKEGKKKGKEEKEPTWLEQKYAELDRQQAEEQAKKEERSKVYDASGKWRYYYGDKKDLEEKDGKLYRKDATAGQPASTRIVKQDSGWAQLFENGKFVKAMSNAAADKLVQERQQRGYEQVSSRIAAATPEGAQRKRDLDEGRISPSNF